MGKAAGELFAKRPNVFVGSMLGEDPDSDAVLLVKGHADDAVRRMAASHSLRIRVVVLQPFSLEELQTRKLLVHRALERRGHLNVATQVGIQEPRRFRVTIGIVAGSAIPSDLIAALRMGRSPIVHVGGSGIHVGEDVTELPSTIAERCETTAVWYAAGTVDIASE